MARTESKSIQVHPKNEQATIDKMQNFGWTLMNAQDVKTVDNHLEKKGDKLYSVTETEHYVKLTFTRDVDLPNLPRIKELETEYDGLEITDDYSLFPGYLIIAAIVSVVVLLVNNILGILLLVGCGGIFYYNYSQKYIPIKAKVEEQRVTFPKRKQEILDEVQSLLI